MAFPPYRQLPQLTGGAGIPGGTQPGRDGITAALMGVQNPSPGYLVPPGAPGAPPFGGIPGGAQPQAALGPAQPPMGPMGSVGGPAVPGLNLPGVTGPGTLPPSMAPQNVLGGMPPQGVPPRRYA